MNRDQDPFQEAMMPWREDAIAEYLAQTRKGRNAMREALKNATKEKKVIP